MKTTVTVCLAALLSIFCTTTVKAQVEVEVDPLAYALEGYSVHVAGAAGRYRIDVGSFGIEIPSAFQRNEDFTASIPWGVGAKAHRFFSEDRRGLFVGLGTGYNRLDVTDERTDVQGHTHQFSAGVEVGYRISLGRTGLYLTPWLGLDHAFAGGEFPVGNRTYSEAAVRIFPTVHLGWRMP